MPRKPFSGQGECGNLHSREAHDSSSASQSQLRSCSLMPGAESVLTLVATNDTASDSIDHRSVIRSLPDATAGSALGPSLASIPRSRQGGSQSVGSATPGPEAVPTGRSIELATTTGIPEALPRTSLRGPRMPRSATLLETRAEAVAAALLSLAVSGFMTVTKTRWQAVAPNGKGSPCLFWDSFRRERLGVSKSCPDRNALQIGQGRAGERDWL
ncbi:hypothetical protein JHW43_001204 [Diplocarpon mali]|nr:hypothetical protein JHW43_001204 [Diplocarpon mali]